MMSVEQQMFFLLPHKFNWVPNERTIELLSNANYYLLCLYEYQRNSVRCNQNEHNVCCSFYTVNCILTLMFMENSKRFGNNNVNNNIEIL